MKLTYLGTAAAEAVPAIFCNCEICKEARKLGGKNVRTRSQALINDDLLLDFPAGTDFPAEEAQNDETIEIFTEGSLRIADGAVTLTYTETDVEGEGTLKTNIRFYQNEPKSVNMIRFGDVNASFFFEEHRRTKCLYNLPFGSMELTIRTVRVDNRLVEDGVLVLDYYIEIRGASAEHKRVTITLRQ